MKPDRAREDLERICKERKLTDEQTSEVIRYYYEYVSYEAAIHRANELEVQNTTANTQTRMEL